jgi:acyl-coenzyme A synthetase/AMP-(fatty) acid ligase
MKAINTILERIHEQSADTALFWSGEKISYANFYQKISDWDDVLKKHHIGHGTVCAILGDYSPGTASLFFALMKLKAILVPLTNAIESEMGAFMEIACSEVLFRFDAKDNWTIEKIPIVGTNPLLEKFHEREEPGLIVFSSGSTGKPKGILQNCEKVMNKFVDKRNGWNTILFLMMDHFGGFNTLLSTFAYGGTAVCLPDRNPETVCQIIQDSKADLLPATPTFLNLLITSRTYMHYNLSSVKLITYGTEVMLPATLQKVKEIFPNAKIKQTYGLSELGVLRSKSESDDSVWVQIGGKGFETKIIDGLLYVRSEANMVGYLNAANPIDAEGWMCTGDQVEVKGEYMRILGRKSDLINVGGQKVFPAEVEALLLEASNISEASVVGKPHPIMGNIVVAYVAIKCEESQQELTERLRKFCMDRMTKFKIPVKFIITPIEELRSERYKKTHRI